MSTFAQKCPVLFIGLCGIDESVVSSLRDTMNGIPQLRLEVCSSAASARAHLARSTFALILIHIPGSAGVADGVTLVKSATGLSQPTKVVVIGEPGQPEHGLTLLRAGAADYLERPLDLRRLSLLIDVLTIRTRQQPAPRPEAVEVARQCVGEETFLYCPSGEMGRTMDQVARVAPVSTTVLIQGETGTGKTRLARVIHNLSSRRNKRFLVVNCAALPATLVESELFGHVKGSFTGADRDRPGKFADAADGTLFLDEIDSLPIGVQAKLLRVVEDRVFEPVGSNTSLPMTARLIAASNTPLSREVQAGRFRSDLFYRLNVVSFALPPLRDRHEVFATLLHQFIEELGTQVGRTITGISPDAMAAMTRYPWPGNVRELRNAIERAVALRPDGQIELDDLPDTVRGGIADVSALTDTQLMPALTDTKRIGVNETARTLPDTAVTPALADANGAPSLAATRDEAEATHIRAVLQKNGNNRSRTATELGVSRETLYKKLRRYGFIGAHA